MWLGYSGAVFVQAYPAQTQEVFFAGHVAAFTFFGGVPREVWYDNLKNAVQKLLRGRNRKEQDSFISFRSHHLFQAEYCNPRSGWEKGGVEGKVGYSRRNWLVGARGFEDWDDLNVYLRQQCELEQQRTLKGRNESIGERLATEQAQLLPLPAPYPGITTLYTELEGFSSGDLTYVTARTATMVTHIPDWMTLHGVPAGPIETGVNIWTSQAEKVRDITRVLEATPGQPFVFFGDSSHRDPEVYREIMNGPYADRVVAVFIHKVNNVNPSRVTGMTLITNYAEAAAKLLELEVLDEDAARRVMEAAQAEGLAISDAEIETLLGN